MRKSKIKEKGVAKNATSFFICGQNPQIFMKSGKLLGKVEKNCVNFQKCVFPRKSGIV